MQLVAPQRFEPCDAPEPDPSALQPGEVLLRTLAGGICGSDLQFFRGVRQLDADAPSHLPAAVGFPGHEIVGVVVASAQEGVHVGETVVGWATAYDAIAEYVITRGDGLTAYSPDLPAEVAVMLQPLACVLAAVDRLGDVAGRTAAVMGQGPIGVLFGHVLKSAGAAHVTGVDRVDRRDVAALFGVDEMVWASADRWARMLPDDRRPEIVVEAIGHQTATLNDAVEAVAHGGQIYYFGIPDERIYPFDLDRFLAKDLTLRSGLTRDRRHWLAAAGEYLAAHPALAAAYVTDVVGPDDITEAYTRAITPKPGQLKIVFTTPAAATADPLEVAKEFADASRH
ncbi:zinc-dependent alcohol dehydrogenase [Microbacterium sp. ASV81]|uniref:Zinc-binding dehydrogenase n=1 Tax=Microbacterium capsulatum TaxID=3041921 RepID=A0ABU0XIL1_9MICO|nr:zinc-binding dehydrogenase [Microbacterium sp. ASV81]MDQ4214967.1 zinc-binding dehydrogenase [Microbacterium sp. ASV81]